MKEILLWLVALAFAFAMAWAVIYDYNKKQSRSVEEYQEDIERQGLDKLGSSLLRAGLLDLEKVLKPDLQKAVAFMEDEKQGMTRQKKQEGDDNDDEKDAVE